MSVYEAFTLALSNLRTNKMRSALTLLGVVIGISSVIMILTLGAGLKSNTLDSLSAFGGSDFTLAVQPIPTAEELQAAGGRQYYRYNGRLDDPEYEFTEDDIERLRAEFGSEITQIGLGEYNTYSGEAFFNGGEPSSSTMKFVNPDMMKMRSIDVSSGRMLTDEDIATNNPVVVVSPQVVSQLFNGNESAALGSEISFEVDNEISYFTIVGVEKPVKLNFLFGGIQASPTIYAPYTLEAYLSDTSGSWQSISVRGPEEADRQQLKTQLEEFINEKLQGNELYEANVRDGQDEAGQINTVLSATNAIVSGIGGISLLVGGIGVMNIMLVTVTERTREIGIRKALGATRRDIRRQFVIEAMVICAIGGIIGVILGCGTGMLGAKALIQVTAFPPLYSIIVAVLFCMGIGLFFGWYPANKAGKLDPIEALRYE